MGKCRMCDLSRIYKQFEKKHAAQKADVPQIAPENISTIATEAIKEPEVVVVQPKKTTKTRTKKVSEPVVEKVEEQVEEIVSEAVVEEKVDE